MKKIILLMLIAIVIAPPVHGIELEAGITYGTRAVADGDIEDVYGDGTVYFPYLALNLWRGITVGFGYEGGYDRSGVIGLYGEDSTLKITGYEFFVAYQLRLLKRFVPYVKLGYGNYSFEQTIDSPFVQGFDDKKSTVTVGGGFKFYLFKGFFAGGEVRYVPLKVSPFNTEVDLGGIRLSLSAGYTFRFKQG